MKRLLIAVLIFTIANLSMAQAEVGLYEFEDTSIFSYSGTGWIQVVDGGYIAMRSTHIGDSVTMTFTGSSVIVYRELRTSTASMEVCIDTTCTTISNNSVVNQKRVPIAFVSNGTPATLTITQVSGQPIWLDYVIVMPLITEGGTGGEELQTIFAPEPSMYYFTLESGRVVAIDFSISGGDIVTGVFLAFLSSLTVFKIVMDRWHHG